jgi:hypothetical protein
MTSINTPKFEIFRSFELRRMEVLVLEAPGMMVLARRQGIRRRMCRYGTHSAVK